MLNPIFKKLKHNNHSQILVLHSPPSFFPHLEEMQGLTYVYTHLSQVKEADFILVFVQTQADINLLVPQVLEKVHGDAIVWFAYPKKSSKNYTADFNRDTGWTIMGTYEYEGVRMVAIDEDWSALRFRQVDYITKLTRSKKMALSEKAKNRTAGK